MDLLTGACLFAAGIIYGELTASRRSKILNGMLREAADRWYLQCSRERNTWMALGRVVPREAGKDVLPLSDEECSGICGV